MDPDAWFLKLVGINEKLRNMHKKNSLAFGEGVLQQHTEVPELPLSMGEVEAESAIRLVS